MKVIPSLKTRFVKLKRNSEDQKDLVECELILSENDINKILFRGNLEPFDIDGYIVDFEEKQKVKCHFYGHYNHVVMFENDEYVYVPYYWADLKNDMLKEYNKLVVLNLLGNIVDFDIEAAKDLL